MHRIAALRISEASCIDAAIRLKLGADWLDVPEPIASCSGTTCATAAT